MQKNEFLAHPEHALIAMLFDKGVCDCCYPSHTVWGEVLSAAQTQSRYQKALLMMKSNLIQSRKNLIDHVGMASIVRHVF